MAEYSSLLEELAGNITNEDLDQLKSACKEDIPSERHEEIATGKDWFGFLEKHNKLDKGGKERGGGQQGRFGAPSPCAAWQAGGLHGNWEGWRSPGGLWVGTEVEKPLIGQGRGTEHPDEDKRLMESLPHPKVSAGAPIMPGTPLATPPPRECQWDLNAAGWVRRLGKSAGGNQDAR